MGRPSLYNAELAQNVLDAMVDDTSLRQICSREGMPSRATVLDWLVDDIDGFQAKYARAKQQQAEAGQDKMRRIESGVLKGTIDHKAANVVLGNMRWRMEKLAPKVYGARMAVEHEISDSLSEKLRAARERTAEG